MTEQLQQDADAFTVVEFARRHRIGRSTAYQEIRSGRLTARKVRDRTIITAEDARTWREHLPKVTVMTA